MKCLNNVAWEGCCALSYEWKVESWLESQMQVPKLFKIGDILKTKQEKCIQMQGTFSQKFYLRKEQLPCAFSRLILISEVLSVEGSLA